MGVEGFLASEDERAARQLVEQADLITQATDDMPPLFPSRLFGRAAAKHDRLYTAQELAELDRRAHYHLARCRPGVADVVV